MVDDDRLAEVKERVAAQHLGDARLGSRLRGGNVAQLRADAELLRDQAGLPNRGRPLPEAALYALRQEQTAPARRVFGT
jgi:hypothetical protein